ncbi:MAG: hypothetical protein LBM68_00490 [Bacteroidales bacterium]|jgi:hypothetical protein|nr:hypothetical protein [Bacteroidales bacterium]
MKQLIIYIGIILVATACNSVDPQPIEANGFNFIPLEQGSVTEYKQTLVHIDLPAGIYDTTEWLLRETMGEQISQSGDSKIYRIEVQRRGINDTAWQPYTVYELQVSNEQIVRVEANTAIVVLRFPMEEGKTWQGNALNTMPNEKFQYRKLNIDTTIQTIVYDSVCEVVHRDFLNLYTLQSQKELYRRNVGLIRKEIYNVESQENDFPGNFNITTPLLDRLTYGDIEILEILNRM